MVFRPAPGTKIRYQTRRHWYEIVAEVSDFVWWGTTIVLSSIGMVGVFDQPRFAWLLLLAVYPLGHLATEVVRWNSEMYYILDHDNGTVEVVKAFGVFRQRIIRDPTKQMGRTETSSLFDRIVGYRRIDLASPSRIYFEGQRVPIQFLNELDKNPPKAREIEDDKKFVQDRLLPWEQAGFVDAALARIAAQSWVMENL